jgi:hypothetical protein
MPAEHRRRSECDNTVRARRFAASTTPSCASRAGNSRNGWPSGSALALLALRCGSTLNEVWPGSGVLLTARGEA